MKKLFIVLLLFPVIVYSQTQADINTKLFNEIALIKVDIKNLKNSILKIEANDTLFINPKNLSNINNILDVINTGGMSSVFLDSVRKSFGDVSQLFLNDRNFATALADSGKQGFNRWRVTDSITNQNNGSLRGLGNSTKNLGIRVDSIVTNMPIPLDLTIIKADIVQLKVDGGLSKSQIETLNIKLEALKLTIPKGLNLNGTLTY